MLCLGIETSCDDTSLALVENGRLAGQETASQAVHALFGGVVPEMASREHKRLIGPLFDRLMCAAGKTPADLDVIAVTRGPGLLGSLLVGVAFAKALALGTGARLVGVNHLHAHLLACGLEEAVTFPAVGLLVSGGHTHLYRMEHPTRFVLLGRTLDDAAGEAFDKAGKMLGLPYPAGRWINELACEGRAQARLFPRPYLDNDNCDFSFSGLKTAMAVRLSAGGTPRAGWDPLSGRPTFPSGAARQELADLCASYSLAVVETLTVKTERALERHPEVASLVLAGGVAANTQLRASMKALAVRRNKKFFAPAPALCADNGAMIAYLGWLLAKAGYYHELDMQAVPRGAAIPDDLLRAAAPG